LIANKNNNEENFTKKSNNMIFNDYIRKFKEMLKNSSKVKSNTR